MVKLDVIGGRGSLRALSAETGLTIEAIQRLTAPSIASKKLFCMPGGISLAGEAMEAAIEGVMGQLKIKAPNNNGLKRSELKGHTGLSPVTFDFVLEKLSRQRKLQLEGQFVSMAGDVYRVSDLDRSMLSPIAAAYEAVGLAAPSAAEVAGSLGLSESEMRRLITLLLHEKTLVKMGGENLIMHSTALGKLCSRMVELRGQKVDVTRFKQMTGLSRKYAIPLLKYLDRERVTRKEGDARLIL